MNERRAAHAPAWRRRARPRRPRPARRETAPPPDETNSSSSARTRLSAPPSGCEAPPARISRYLRKAKYAEARSGGSPRLIISGARERGEQPAADARRSGRLGERQAAERAVVAHGAEGEDALQEGPEPVRAAGLEPVRGREHLRRARW